MHVHQVSIADGVPTYTHKYMKRLLRLETYPLDLRISRRFLSGVEFSSFCDHCLFYLMLLTHVSAFGVCGSFAAFFASNQFRVLYLAIPLRAAVQC